MLKKASSLPKVERTPEKYLSERIESASNSGYSNTKAWLYDREFAMAEEMLIDAGYTYTVIATDEATAKTQIEISW